MTSKVPKFGAWEGGDNFTVYFDNARKNKNGPKINPNDPEENPELFRQNPGSAQALIQAQNQTRTAPNQTRPDQQRKQTKVPQFGAWENEESSGYTVCFDNVRKNKNHGPTVSDNEPQMNRDMPSRYDPSVQSQGQGQGQVRGQGQGQGRTMTGRPESKEGRAKVPQFGEWDSQGGGGGYTAVFDNLKKKPGPHSNGPQPNRDVGSTPQEGRAKVPQFGAWEGGEAVQYTAYFDNAKKSKNLREVGMNPNEPQMNRDVGGRGRSPPVAVPKADYQDDVSRHANLGSTTYVQLHPKANLQAQTGAGRGNYAGGTPLYGSRNGDPVPVPNRQHHQQQQQPYRQPLQKNKQKQQSCCTIM